MAFYKARYSLFRRSFILKDLRVQAAIMFHEKAIFWKKTRIGYPAALKYTAYGLHAIQDIYAHLDATPWMHMYGKNKDRYDDVKVAKWRRARSRRATGNYIKWFLKS